MRIKDNLSMFKTRNDDRVVHFENPDSTIKNKQTEFKKNKSVYLHFGTAETKITKSRTNSDKTCTKLENV